MPICRICILKAANFGSSHREVFWKHMSGSKLSGLQVFSKGICKDFGHIFLICSKTFIKILKVGKIFQFVISFYQYFFVNDKRCYYKTSSGNSYINISLTVISMSYATPFLYKAGMSKLFSFFSVGFNGALYGTF